MLVNTLEGYVSFEYLSSDLGRNIWGIISNPFHIDHDSVCKCEYSCKVIITKVLEDYIFDPASYAIKGVLTGLGLRLSITCMKKVSGWLRGRGIYQDI